ncbi:MAG: hypothetical protein ACK6D4_21295, partial [Planctomyces sp.]
MPVFRPGLYVCCSGDHAGGSGQFGARSARRGHGSGSAAVVGIVLSWVYDDRDGDLAGLSDVCGVGVKALAVERCLMLG